MERRIHSALFVDPHGEHTPSRACAFPIFWRKHMQMKSLPAILGGSGRRVASEVAVSTRLACALLKSVPRFAVKQVLFARAVRMEVSHG